MVPSVSSSTDFRLAKFYTRSLVASLSAFSGSVLGFLLISLLLQIGPNFLLTFKIGLLSLGAVFGFNLGAYIGICHWRIIVTDPQENKLQLSTNYNEDSIATIQEIVYSPDLSAVQASTKMAEYLYKPY
jgi:hypothetical protein